MGAAGYEMRPVTKRQKCKIKQKAGRQRKTRGEKGGGTQEKTKKRPTYSGDGV